MTHVRVVRALVTAAALTCAVSLGSVPAHADLGDVAGVVDSSIPDPETELDVTGTVERVEATARQTLTEAQDSGEKVVGGAASSPAPAETTVQDASPADSDAPTTRPAGERDTSTRATTTTADTSSRVTGREKDRPGRQQHLRRAARRIPVSLAGSTSPSFRPGAVRVDHLVRESLKLPPGCQSSSSLDPAELRRCAFAETLVDTGGVRFGLLPTGVGLVISGAMALLVRRRRASVPKLVLR